MKAIVVSYGNWDRARKGLGAIYIPDHNPPIFIGHKTATNGSAYANYEILEGANARQSYAQLASHGERIVEITNETVEWAEKVLASRQTPKEVVELLYPKAS